MSYESTLAYIHSESWQKHKNGLNRIRSLLQKLGDPQKRLRFVHVAGTNGKGSTCAMLDSILREAGYRTGLFTSPYLRRFNERMRVNGEEISDFELERITNTVRPVAEALEETPSEFELITAIALIWFLQKKCDIVVLEVGLGGEFDSTNVIDPPECAVITAIGLDHTAMLGNTIPEIAEAKAGIIKSGSYVVSGTGSNDAEKVICRIAKEKNVTYAPVNYNEIRINHMDENGTVFDFKDLFGISIPLVGDYQPRNAAVAIEAIYALRDRGYTISDTSILEGLASVSWPGRFEILSRHPLFILDGAHNPHGITATTESLMKCFPGRRFIFLISVMRDKNAKEMIKILVPLAERFFTIRPEYDRALNEEELAEMIREENGSVEACSTVKEGVRRAIITAGSDGAICALGSLYVSAAIREAVEQY